MVTAGPGPAVPGCVPSGQPREPFRARSRPAVASRAGIAAAAVGISLLLIAGTGFDYEPTRAAGETDAVPRTADDLNDAEAERLRSDHRRLNRELERLVPRGGYVVIDQTHNRIRLMRGTETLLDAPCSTGSGHVLREGAGGRVWVFDTPRGAFSVISKIRHPVWKKPDWAFVEEGQPIPQDPGERFEYGVLGEYALYFGDGYLIHGTLYERLIGRPVSHGCIRVGRVPLREIYRLVPVGAPVFIY